MSENHASAVSGMSPDEKHRMYIGSFWLFIIAEAMIFVTLFSTRFLLAGLSGSTEINQVLGIISTVLMLISVWTIQQAMKAVHAEQQNGLARQLILTALLGLIVLLLNGYEWMTSALDWGSRYGEMYYILTLFHELHILGGVIALFAMAVHSRRGSFSPRNYWPVKAVQIYWLFVVLIWLCVYVLLYLI